MPASSTYTPIATASPVGSVDFLNIPQTYTDLIAVVYGRDTAIPGPFQLCFFGFNNLAVSSTYTSTRLRADGSIVQSDRLSANQFSVGDVPGTAALAGVFGSTIIHINNYTNSTAFKTILVRGADDTNGTGATTLTTGMWANTAAITSLQFRNTFAAGSTITLYGIKAA
jgi:hypothetical protein